jgi:hypothetical protein
MLPALFRYGLKMMENNEELNYGDDDSDEDGEEEE